MLLRERYEKELEEVKKEAMAVGSKYLSILQSPHALWLLDHLVLFAAHFRLTKHFKIAGLQPFVDIHGGVSDDNILNLRKCILTFS